MSNSQALLSYIGRGSKCAIERIDFHDLDPQSKLQRMINYRGYFATGPNGTLRELTVLYSCKKEMQEALKTYNILLI